MPRNVRNAWVTVNIEGKATRLSGGPRNKAGGLVAEFLVRDNGGVGKGVSVSIRPSPTRPDVLLLIVTDDRTGSVVFSREVSR
jgi:hypothetical protein